MENIADYLSIAKDENIKRAFDPGESLLYSDIIYKRNPMNWRQKRNIIITNMHIYNFKSKELKRRINLDLVAAVTISENKDSNEFVIHVPDEYDYRYDSDK